MASAAAVQQQILFILLYLECVRLTLTKLNSLT